MLSEELSADTAGVKHLDTLVANTELLHVAVSEGGELMDRASGRQIMPW